MNYNLFGYALATTSVLWLVALLSGVLVSEKIDPIVTRVILGEKDYSQLTSKPITVSAAEMKRIVDTETWIMRINALLFLWVLPMVPLLVLRWAKWWWRVTGTIAVFFVFAFTIS